ncbi:MAG: hypothetical protein R3C61_24670 [Bacteroidia bacterium]
MKKILSSLIILGTASLIFITTNCQKCTPPPDGCPGGMEFNYEDCSCPDFCSPLAEDIQACHSSGGEFDYERCECLK